MRFKTLFVFIGSLAALAQQATFTNPLLPSGADPWVTYKDGWYYYTHTTGRNVTLWRTHNLAELPSAEKKIIWTPPAGTAYSKDVWAPEIHWIADKWYVYVAADDGRNRNHRIYVLENSNRDPLEGDWTLKGQLVTPDDRWAIDASVFQLKNQMYLIWSGWEGDENGEQDIYICRMKNPWTTEGPRVRISRPELSWETVGDIPKPGPDDKPHVNVNEGPEALIHGNRVFIIYSASGCWTDSYALGMLSARTDAELLDPNSWQKVDHPVFKAAGSGAKGTYAAGHNSFFRSPDGTQDWILYHANSEPGQGCGSRRSPRAQPFSWRPDGTPDFGTPVSAGQPLPIPSEIGQSNAAPTRGQSGSRR